MRGICGPVMATAVGLEAIPSTSSSSSREKSKRKFRADLASPPGAQFFQQEENHHRHHDGGVAAGNGDEDENGLMNWGPGDTVSRDPGSKSKSLSLDGDGGVDVEDVAAKDTEECVRKVDDELGLGGGGGDGMGKGMGVEVGVGLDAIVAGDCGEELENNWKTEPEPELEELLVTSLEAVFNDVIRKIVVQGFSKEEALKVFSKQAGWLREGGSVVPASIVEDALTYLADRGRRIPSSDPNNVNNALLGSSNLADDGKALQRRILSSMLKKLRENRPALSRGDAMWCLLMSDMNVENALSFEDSISHSPLQLSKTMPGSSPSPSPFPNPSTEGTKPTPVSNASTEILAESCSPVSSSSSSNGEILRASSIPLSTPPPQVEGLSAGGESRVSCDLSMGQKPESSSLQSSSSSGCLPTMVMADWSQATKLEETINKTEEEAENRKVGSEELQGQGSSGGSGGEEEEEHLSNSPGKEVDKNLQQEDGGSSSTSPSDERGGLPDVGSKNQQRECGQPEGNSPQSGSRKLAAQSPDEDSRPGASVCTGPAETNLSLGVSTSTLTEGLQGSDVKRGDTTTVSTAEGRDVSSQDNILAGININVEARRAETLVCLQIRVRDLEMQLVDRTEWAQQKVMQAARRLSKDRNEMNSLRAERDELMRAKKDQKTLEDNTTKKLADMEAALRRASGQVDRANQAVSRLEKENAEVRAEMEAAKLNAAESMELCQEVAKKEKKDVKKAQCWEKQKAKLQESLAEERAKVTELKHQLAQAKELQQQAEVSRRQEEKAKEDAVKRANDGKRLREKAETDFKKREDALRRNAELDKRRLRDDIDRLSQELSTYKATERAHFAGSSWGSSVTTVGVTGAGVGMKRNDRNERPHRDDEDRDVRRDRECVMCMYEEVSVVFLPCAHQVVCAGCDEVHKNHGISNCPSCRTPIQQRIRVYGPS